MGPAAYYNPAGPEMFFVYYMILAAPLIIVIPYFAYNSMASERHDRTYELVSITALDATKILWGKLGGIGMQMVVYLSALFPCLAFTYVLRGLDIFSVLLVVLYTCLLSLGMAMLGYRAGDTFEWEVPAGTRRMEIIEILYQPEASGDYHL